MARRMLILGLFVVGVALIFVAGVHNLRSRKAAMLKSQESEVVLAKANAPSDTGADPDAQPMLGKTAPQFTLVDLSGKKVSLSQFKGHPIVMNFWATYCGPCRLEMPWFQQLQSKYQGQGLVILGLDQDDGMATKDIAEAVKKVGVSYPILLPDDKVAALYQLGDYLPATIYIDKSGKIVDQTVGAHSKDELEADIQKAIGAGAA